jgi:hypothetical protein
MTRGSALGFSTTNPEQGSGYGGAISAAELQAANINPRSRLATDYLNHFNEPVMLLEMIAAMPEESEDFLAWKPLTYPEHFRASGFKARELAIQAYETAPAEFREPFDETVASMMTILVALQEGLQTVTREETRIHLATQGANWMRPLIAHAAGLIQGHPEDGSEDPVPQAEVDMIMTAS